MAKWVRVTAPLPPGIRGWWKRWSGDAGMVCTDVGLTPEQADEVWIDARTAAEQSVSPDGHEESP